jgi:hypothetical protein
VKIGTVLKELHRSENDLAHLLLVVSDRHKVDHDIYYVAKDLAAWSQRHVREIARLGHDYGEDLDPEPRGESGLVARVQDLVSELTGRMSVPGLLLLRDLRQVYIHTAGVNSDWDLLAQAAQGIKHTDLLSVAEACHPETKRQMQWAEGKLKESATQVLVS